MKKIIAIFCLAILLCSAFDGIAVVASAEKVVKFAGDWFPQRQY